ncbi:MAG: ribonuclease III [Lautropia sp. SCN 66-9]|nr:MAG: ribonuclease III [Lautropia sp. SCN 66-9]
MSLDDLQRQLGHRFSDAGLLRQALTHRSHSQPNNERLEFLGDSVLNCVVAAMLYQHFGKLDEGDLSRVRANLVKQQSLYEIAQRIGLSQHLLLGEGELKSGGFRRPSILGDTLEALVGAVFLDAGFEAAQSVIRALYEPVLKSVDPKTLGKDAKTLLQEYLQGKKLPLPVYSVVATHGAAHSQVFEVECAIPKLQIQVLGSGASRRAAEQAAARGALDAALALVPASGRRVRSRADKAVDKTADKATDKAAAAKAEKASDNPESAADSPEPAGSATPPAQAGDTLIAGLPGPKASADSGAAAVEPIIVDKPLEKAADKPRSIRAA